MPTLNWIGKDKVINHHQDVPFRVLDYRYTHGEENSGNMIIHGDNLDALKSLLPKYEGRIKCIYIDPPYNTGNEGWVYNDNVNDPKIRKWLGEVVGKEGEDLSRHDKWLCMMYPRLMLLHRLLVDNGAIFISIDDSEVYALKLLCDEILGCSNFMADVIWQHSLQSNGYGGNFVSQYNHTIVYRKSSDFILGNLPRTEDETNIIYKIYLDSLDGRVPTNLWLGGDTGTTRSSNAELKKIFDGKTPFDTPKPVELIERILQITTSPGDIVLDSFAGSGTTAHAVLNLNTQDNGNRKFILIEMMDYAETITAERVRRVIDGYADKAGTGSGFNYYELGEPLLLPDGNLNENISTEKIYEYIWHTETKTAYAPQNQYYLGAQLGTAYFFYYERDDITVLDSDFLKTHINQGVGTAQSERYVIYADVCAFDNEDLERFNIIFKKIPRDISRI